MRRALLYSAVVVITVSIAGAALLFRSTNEPKIAQADANTLAIGERLYLESCASCHGVSLEGQPNWKSRNAAGRLPAPPHNASGHTWHHSLSTLFDITKLGLARMLGTGYESDMPAFDSRLSDDEIWAVLLYIRAQWPPEIRKIHSEIEAKGKS